MAHVDGDNEMRLSATPCPPARCRQGANKSLAPHSTTRRRGVAPAWHRRRAEDAFRTWYVVLAPGRARPTSGRIRANRGQQEPQIARKHSELVELGPIGGQHQGPTSVAAARHRSNSSQGRPTSGRIPQNTPRANRTQATSRTSSGPISINLARIGLSGAAFITFRHRHLEWNRNRGHEFPMFPSQSDTTRVDISRGGLHQRSM